MRVKIIILLFVLISVNSWLNSTTYHIKQDGTGNFITIQEGIDSCVNSDTILVYPGTYFENLVIEEKYMTIGSLYLTTGDESYISQTIIDGFENDSVIRIESVPDWFQVYISGFVIQNGYGYINAPNGQSKGGGFFLNYADATIKKCSIHNNYAGYGGGIYLHYYSNLILIGNTIRFNNAYNKGGGIRITYFNHINFDSQDLNNIYLNNGGVGSDIQLSHWSGFHEIIVDTFTVVDPAEDYYYIYPSSNGAGYPQPDLFTIDIQHAKIEQENCDLYVSPDGDNNNSGTSESEPLQSIAYALAKIRSDSLIHRTIHIADGVYSSSLNDQKFPLHIKSNVSLIGASREGTILDAEFEGGHIYAYDPQRNYTIKNLSLINSERYNNITVGENTGVLIDNVTISSNNLGNLGFSAIHINFSDITLRNLLFENNQYVGSIYFYSAKYGSELNITNSIFRSNAPSVVACKQIYCHRATSLSDSLTVNVINTEITDNLDASYEWPPAEVAMRIAWETKVNIINCTIGNNECINNGAAVLLCDESEANIVNSILYGDIPHEICLDGRWGTNTLNANNSLIDGGISNIFQLGNNFINWDDETMLDEDPLWLGAGADWPYALSANSPCIDTGTLVLPYGVELPAYDLAGNPRVCGNGIDMGAYEFPGNAAPIYLEIENATLSWQLPTGYLVSGFNIYLDEEYQTTLNGIVTEFTFPDLIEGHTYIAGVSALYGTEETVVINLEFIYDPVGTEVEIPISQIQITNYPNPFNPTTTIKLELAESGKMELAIYNIKGQKVKTLMDAYSAKGHFEVVWRGTDENEKKVASGNYFAKLKVNGDIKAVRKLILLK
ncbi:MAG: T9SS type A sorting domain-containing protein [Armatimonadetes bacterium]|nr:T9SS type A sorting domain-containing protein [Armatimonadota bacterium]